MRRELGTIKIVISDIQKREEVKEMNVQLQDLRSQRNPKARIKIVQGHFARSNSHGNTYIDISTIKCRCDHAREAAKVLAESYLTTTDIDTIVCLDGMEVVGAFLVEQLAGPDRTAKNRGKNISVVAPEKNQLGQMMFRDDTKRMIKGQNILILASSINTGNTMMRAINTVLYYGGRVNGVCAIFSAVSKVAGMEIRAIFTKKDVPGYQVYPANDCPMCREKKKVNAIVNNYGYSEL